MHESQTIVKDLNLYLPLKKPLVNSNSQSYYTQSSNVVFGREDSKSRDMSSNFLNKLLDTSSSNAWWIWAMREQESLFEQITYVTNLKQHLILGHFKFTYYSRLNPSMNFINRKNLILFILQATCTTNWNPKPSLQMLLSKWTTNCFLPNRLGKNIKRLSPDLLSSKTLSLILWEH